MMIGRSRAAPPRRSPTSCPSAAAKGVDVVDQDDRIVHHDADEDDQSRNTMIVTGIAASHRTSATPIIASGTVIMMRSGCTNDSNWLP